MRIGNIFVVLLLLGCSVQKYSVQKATENRSQDEILDFRMRCMKDSCYQLSDVEKRRQILSRINMLFAEGKIKYAAVDSSITTDGVYYGLRLYKEGFNERVCDSLKAECEKDLPVIYQKYYVQSQEPPCEIDGCYGRAILDSNLVIVWIR